MLGHALRPTIVGPEIRTQNKFSPLRCWNPHKALTSLVLFNSSSKKFVLSQIAFPHCRESLPHRARVATKLGARMLH